MTKMLRILELHSTEVTKVGIAEAVAGYASHEVATITPLNKETALRAFFDSFDGQLWLFLAFFLF